MYEKYVVKSWEEQGYTVPAPYKREVQHIFAPDKREVKELIFSRVVIPSESQTDNHSHDRGELIYVVTGRGQFSIGEETYDIVADMALWVPKGAVHQIKNIANKPITIVTVFVPPYKSRETKDSILRRAEGGRI